MNTHIKKMLMLTAVVGLSSPSVAMACRDYNFRTWNQGGRTAARSLSASRLYGADRPRGDVVERSQPASKSVAQAPTERRALSYEPSETSQSPTSAGSKSTAAPAPQIKRRSYSYEPLMSSGRSSHRSAGAKKDPWQYPKSDPRRYQVH